MPVEKLKETTVLADQRGFTEKAKVLREYIEHLEGEEYVRTTDKVRSDLERKRLSQSVRPARN